MFDIAAGVATVEVGVGDADDADEVFAGDEGEGEGVGVGWPVVEAIGFFGVVDDEGLACLGDPSHNSFSESEGGARVAVFGVVGGDDLQVVVFRVVETEFAGGGSGEGNRTFEDIFEELGEFEFTEDFVHGGAEGVEFLDAHAFSLEEASVLDGDASLASD